MSSDFAQMFNAQFFLSFCTLQLVLREELYVILAILNAKLQKQAYLICNIVILSKIKVPVAMATK